MTCKYKIATHVCHKWTVVIRSNVDDREIVFAAFDVETALTGRQQRVRFDGHVGGNPHVELNMGTKLSLQPAGFIWINHSYLRELKAEDLDPVTIRAVFRNGLPDLRKILDSRLKTMIVGFKQERWGQTGAVRSEDLCLSLRLINVVAFDKDSSPWG